MFSVIGMAATLSYYYAWKLQDLRQHSVEFLVAFFTAFLLYALATSLVIAREKPSSPYLLVAILGFSMVWCSILIFSPPTLSDDMYRYIWDGRVQAHGINPYLYPPSAPELNQLRDDQIYPLINRKTAVTVYPPGAEMVFASLWRLYPDSVRWFQFSMAIMAILAGVLLVYLLRDLGKPIERSLIYLWSPLLIFETAHASHIDGLVLPFLVGAWWSRVRERDSLTGFLLGVATSLKLYPALLLPALWRPNHPQGRWKMPLGFISAVLICYLPLTLKSGINVVGFLPDYLREQFNVSPLVAWILENIPHQSRFEAQRGLLILTVTLLVIISLIIVLHPAQNGEAALRRCLWVITVVTLLSQNLFPWYMLWLLPLLAVFIQPGRMRWRGQTFQFGFRLDAWTGWWLFCGLIALSYTFFLNWKSIKDVIRLEYWVLYLLLGIDLLRRVIRPLLQIKEVARP